MLRFNSAPDNINTVESLVDSVVNRYCLTPDQKGNILISLTEAVTNALRHGNHYDETKSVEVRLQKLQDKLTFRITDEGNGFDFHNLPDPTSPENIHKCGGRGVFLMRQLADEVRFCNNGSTVEMRFKI